MEQLQKVSNLRQWICNIQILGMTLGFGALLIRIMIAESEYWSRTLKDNKNNGRPTNDEFGNYRVVRETSDRQGQNEELGQEVTNLDEEHQGERNLEHLPSDISHNPNSIEGFEPPRVRNDRIYLGEEDLLPIFTSLHQMLASQFENQSAFENLSSNFSNIHTDENNQERQNNHDTDNSVTEGESSVRLSTLGEPRSVLGRPQIPKNDSLLFDIPEDIIISLSENKAPEISNAAFTLLLRRMLMDRNTVVQIVKDMISDDKKRWLSAITALHMPIQKIRLDKLPPSVNASLARTFTRPLLKSLSLFSRRSPPTVDREWFFCFARAIDQFTVLAPILERDLGNSDEFMQISRKTNRMIRNYCKNFGQSEFKFRFPQNYTDFDGLVFRLFELKISWDSYYE